MGKNCCISMRAELTRIHVVNVGSTGIWERSSEARPIRAPNKHVPINQRSGRSILSDWHAHSVRSDWLARWHLPMLPTFVTRTVTSRRWLAWTTSLYISHITFARDSISKPCGNREVRQAGGPDNGLRSSEDETLLVVNVVYMRRSTH